MYSNKIGSKRSRTKPRRAAKREVIVETLRREIARGKFKPGDQLPYQLVASRQFGVSVLTVQRAMDRLAHEGFIETRHRQGTFVVDHPPHLNNYAFIFPDDPADPAPGGWSHFHATLANEAMKIQQAGKRRFECFYGINAPLDTPDYRRLVAKAGSHQFAGLIFASHPNRLLRTPLAELEGIARVGLMGEALGNIPSVYFKQTLWFERAFHYLKSRGHQRVAFINMASPHSMVKTYCPPSLLTSRGLITRPCWNLPLPLWTEGASHIVQLLMQSAGERPDALVITDDNVVEPAVAGLMAAGVRVPDDIEVIAHANFPRIGPGVLPLKWLGYDNREALEACVSVIDQQCRGENPPRDTWIAPVFEEEMTARKPAVFSPSR